MNNYIKRLNIIIIENAFILVIIKTITMKIPEMKYMTNIPVICIIINSIRRSNNFRDCHCRNHYHPYYDCYSCCSCCYC